MWVLSKRLCRSLQAPSVCGVFAVSILLIELITSLRSSSPVSHTTSALSSHSSKSTSSIFSSNIILLSLSSFSPHFSLTFPLSLFIFSCLSFSLSFFVSLVFLFLSPLSSPLWPPAPYWLGWCQYNVTGLR